MFLGDHAHTEHEHESPKGAKGGQGQNGKKRPLNWFPIWHFQKLVELESDRKNAEQQQGLQ